MIIQSNPDEDDASLKYPIMRLAQDMHKLTVLSPAERLELETSVFDEIATTLKNPSLYKILRNKLYDSNSMDSSSSSSKLLTDAELDTLTAENTAHMATLHAAFDTAVESAGDMEVADAQVAIAQYSAQALDCTSAIAAYQKIATELPKVSLAKQMDAFMAMARIHSFYGNVTQADAALEEIKKLMGTEADWDRRNRAGVYTALQQLLHRDFASAAKPLLSGVATFNCIELCSYKEFVVYGILTNLLHLPRQELKSKIIDGPEILSIAKDIPIVMRLVRSFYDCSYNDYLHALVDVEKVLLEDRFLQPHADYWLRQLHVLAYKQYLDSYVTVRVSAMAEAFGVSEAFIDHHCSSMIAAGSLSAKIDKYGGVIVTARPDAANAKYRDVIQKGDLLLNRIQKLARVVDL